MKRKKKSMDNKSDWFLRKRRGFRVVLPVGQQIPSCLHGPCLLFERKIDKNKKEKFFSCAVYRSHKCCSFRLNITGDIPRYHILDRSSIFKACSRTYYYAAIRKKVNSLKAGNNEIFYCTTCNDVFTAPHIHVVKGPLKVADIRKPSQLFSAYTQKSSESQFWFSVESLLLLVNAIENFGTDGVLCIGTPTVFEYFQSQKILRKNIKSFLLDIDARFAPFWRSSHFAVYSMMTNFFFDPKSLDKLIVFFKSVHHLVIICDPPFGVFIEVLMESLKKLREQFFSTRMKDWNDSWCKYIIVLPIFTGKRFLVGNEFHMLDYKICYVNHSRYKRSEKSVVRIFTDLPLKAFDLSSYPEYKFCDKCDKFVAKSSSHCNLCHECPAEINMSKHCYECGRCVRGTYRHCAKCSCCHLPRRCLEIQKIGCKSSIQLQK
ncbi:unnamed protein product [Thelazia callipaeda]|uniref:CTCHY-type domain-containing protein n=1 Tax=Thelazia callipaeda TaxID=103827 RepID=A0A0N5CY49_THECL|nr:unnamed protein product [Thelazia callipaeda]